MGLLLADLRALGNVLVRRDGRRLLIGHGVALALITALSWLQGETTLHHPELLAALVGEQGEQSVRALLGSALSRCGVCAGWLGIGLLQRQLLDVHELPLWRMAPCTRLRPPLQAMLRTLFSTLLWSLALAGPFAVMVLQQARAPTLAYALLPLLMVAAVLPMLCTLGAIEILLTALFAGRLLRALFVAAAALASVAFSLFLMTGMFQQPEQQAAQLAANPGGNAPWTIDAAAHALAMLCGQRGELRDLLPASLWVAGTALAFLLLSRLHPRAVEAHLRAGRPMRLRRQRRWPSPVAASLRKKELAQMLQQPAQLFGMLAFGVMVFVLAQQDFFNGILRAPGLPPLVQQGTAMLVLWFIAVLLVLFAHMGRLVLWDSQQWSLYVVAPAPPAAILRGKLQGIFLLLLWPVIVVALIGHYLLRADGQTLLWFGGLALAGNLIALGVVATVGTLPLLMRPDPNGQMPGSWRSFLATLLLVFGFDAAVSPGFIGWNALAIYVARRGTVSAAQAMAFAPKVLGVAWLLALVLGGGGVWLGGRNFRRLLRAR
jgi:hypothetical protein